MNDNNIMDGNQIVTNKTINSNCALTFQINIFHNLHNCKDNNITVIVPSSKIILINQITSNLMKVLFLHS